ncbi:MAG: carbohydrate kinase family protein [Anaerolineae bacterium]|jgi:sugar/nucleoside kinase (ribokinase family)|nr:carbohydrate kinase family protein [Anaerolineae bacterium]MDH7475384.1 carbohydrate kinase family protein [Anaerolineae bacterium]
MKRLLVIGELNVDLIISGLPSLPVLGQELLCQDFEMTLGSSSAICASWLAALGATVDFWGKVGCDLYGEFVVGELERRGIGTDGVIRDSSIRTGVTVSLSYPHDRALFTYLGSIAALRLSDLHLGLLSRYDHLHSASIFLQRELRPGLPALYRAAKKAGLTTSLDSGWDPEEQWGRDVFDVLPHVDFFLPNETEALHLTGANDIEEAATELSCYAGTVVVKLGREGALACTGGQVWKASGFKVEVVDTTGAGDAFNAGFLYAHVIEGRPIPEALHFANACGAIAVTIIGGATALPSAAEVDAFIEEWQ